MLFQQNAYRSLFNDYRTNFPNNIHSSNSLLPPLPPFQNTPGRNTQIQMANGKKITDAVPMIQQEGEDTTSGDIR